MIIKSLKVTILAIFTVLFVVFGAYYLVSFAPYISALKALSHRGQEVVAPVEARVYQLAIVAEGDTAIRSWAMRQGYSNLAYKHRKGATISWQLDNALWLLASYIHLDDQEVFGIWVECVFSTCRDDLNAAAHKYFGENLATLSDHQLGAIVASARSPVMFAPGSDRGKIRTKEILRRARDT